MEAITRLPVSWPLSHFGKVRDTLEIMFGGIVYRLPFSSDRASIFDFELPFGIPLKGEVLNALTIFWRLYLRRESNGQIEDDLIAFGLRLNDYLPDELKGNRHLLLRSILSEKLVMLLIEAVSRTYLTGNGFTHYKESLAQNKGERAYLCGHELPPGLCDGQKLTRTLFTPTTKAPRGEHDEDMPVQEVRITAPLLEPAELVVSDLVSRKCLASGLIKADEKNEFGYRLLNDGLPDTTKLVLGDETATFDCARYWDAEEYARVWPGTLPKSKDKEYLRDWGKTLGIDKLDPKNLEHRKFVASLATPHDVVKETTRRCLELFERIVGKPLDAFQREEMGIPAD